MASSAKESRKVVEGVFAINKPQWASSAGVLRDLQETFASPKSTVLKPWLESQRRNMILSQAKRRHIDNLKVKLGHGGTLDPLATGVLIVGVGKGTKHLGKFLECTKSYECVVLFGAATDSYDAVGKVVSKAGYDHITKEMVEEKLAQFRGKIKQKPSIFSALKVDGKKMYVYAREGKDIPEVAARDVEVHELELVEWLEPGTHEYKWPKEEVDGEEQADAEKLMGIRQRDAEVAAKRNSRKRERERSPSIDHVTNAEGHPKKPRTNSEPAMSGALPVEQENKTAEEGLPSASQVPNSAPVGAAPSAEVAEPSTTTENPSVPEISEPAPQPPAARLRMTVTSGFYVRSLCHDLGLACDSVGFMSSLVRSRQGDYELGKNVLEYTDLEAGPEVWEPKIAAYLEEFMAKEGWEAEEVEDEETWKAKKGELEKERREGDRDRSYKGGWKGRGRGRGGRNYYSKDMKGGRDNRRD